MTATYEVDVERDGKWWMINVPEIDGLTQARRLSEVEDMARSLISVSTDTPLTDIDVKIESIHVSPHLADVVELTRDIKAKRNVIRELEATVHRDSREFAYFLEAEGIPVRDIAELLGVSPQRVSQLLNEQGEPALNTADDDADVTDGVSDLPARLEASVKRRRLEPRLTSAPDRTRTCDLGIPRP